MSLITSSQSESAAVARRSGTLPPKETAAAVAVAESVAVAVAMARRRT